LLKKITTNFQRLTVPESQFYGYIIIIIIIITTIIFLHGLGRLTCSWHRRVAIVSWGVHDFFFFFGVSS
jgi:hypothetical protein